NVILIGDEINTKITFEAQGIRYMGCQNYISGDLIMIISPYILGTNEYGIKYVFSHIEICVRTPPACVESKNIRIIRIFYWYNTPHISCSSGYIPKIILCLCIL